MTTKNKGNLSVWVDKKIKDKAMNIVQNNMKITMTEYIERNLKELVKKDNNKYSDL